MASKKQKEHIRRTLKQCALEIDPEGKLIALANEMYVSPKVFSYWVKHGRVPEMKAKWLADHFPLIVRDPATLIG